MSNFSQNLLSWFKKNKRSLPWREDKNPYFIWLSEIILQQTRVEQGLPYFERFRSAFPKVKDLANADIDEILKLWQGLGYYSRARNLHAAAKMIRDEHDGQFPDKYNDILKLKGVGDYTAAAIASIAFDEVVPVVDGNVFRLATRYFGIEEDIQKTGTRKLVKNILQEEIDAQKPGDFNQAMMEYGSLVCKPRQARCEDCVLSSGCYALANNKVDTLPIKIKKQRIKERFFNYLVLDHKGQTLLNKRNNKDIWQGLYEFPQIESERLLSEQALFDHSSDIHKLTGLIQFKLLETYDLSKHVLSHQHIYSRFFILSGESDPSVSELVSKSELGQYPVSRMIDKFLESRPEFLSKKS